MKQEEFAGVVLDAKILTPDEIVTFFKFFSSLEISPPLGFSDTRRRAEFVHRCETFTLMVEIGSWDVIEFKVDKDIILNGLRLFDSRNEFYSLDTLQLYHGNPEVDPFSVPLPKSESSASPSVQLGTDSPRFSYHGFEFLFNSKPSLKKNTLYYIKVVISGPKYRKGCRGLKRVEKGGVTFTFSTPQIRRARVESSVEHGQLAEFLFCLPN